MVVLIDLDDNQPENRFSTVVLSVETLQGERKVGKKSCNKYHEDLPTMAWTEAFSTMTDAPACSTTISTCCSSIRVEVHDMGSRNFTYGPTWARLARVAAASRSTVQGRRPGRNVPRRGRRSRGPPTRTPPKRPVCDSFGYFDVCARIALSICFKSSLISSFEIHLCEEDVLN